MGLSVHEKGAASGPGCICAEYYGDREMRGEVVGRDSEWMEERGGGLEKMGERRNPGRKY